MSDRVIDLDAMEIPPFRFRYKGAERELSVTFGYMVELSRRQRSGDADEWELARIVLAHAGLSGEEIALLQPQQLKAIQDGIQPFLDALGEIATGSEREDSAGSISSPASSATSGEATSSGTTPVPDAVSGT